MLYTVKLLRQRVSSEVITSKCPGQSDQGRKQSTWQWLLCVYRAFQHSGAQWRLGTILARVVTSWVFSSLLYCPVQWGDMVEGTESELPGDCFPDGRVGCPRWGCCISLQPHARAFAVFAGWGKRVVPTLHTLQTDHSVCAENSAALTTPFCVSLSMVTCLSAWI